jgi:hypothetical protein
MSDLEQLVPSLDLCQKLKAAGFPQDTALTWVNVGQGFWSGGGLGIKDGVMQLIPTTPSGGYADEVRAKGEVNSLCEVLCAAPTAEEIQRELPWTLQPWLPNVHPVFLQVRHTPDGFRVAWLTWNNAEGVPCDDDDKHYEKESEAAAQAYLWWRGQP